MFFPLLNNVFYYPYSYYGYKIYRYASNGPFDFKYVSERNNNRSSSNTVEDIKTIEDKQLENTDKINLLGFDLNIDDLVIVFVIFTMFRESSLDYSVIIALFIMLFDQS